MKECPSCKAKNQNDAFFCTECGTSLKDIPATVERGFLDKAKEAAVAGTRKARDAAAVGAQKAKEAANAGAEKVHKAIEDAEKKAEEAKARGVAAGGWDNAVDTPSVTSSFNAAAPQMGNTILVDQSESIVSTIGSGYLQNFLSGGSVGKGIGILTQKRFYYKGKNYSGSGKGMSSTTQEGVVSLEDITFTLLTHVRHTGLLIFAIMLTVAAIILNFTVLGRTFTYLLILLAATIPFYILYFVIRTSVFQVCFPGGGFGFNIRWYPISDIRDFQRQLHLLKDHIKESAET